MDEGLADVESNRVEVAVGGHTPVDVRYLTAGNSSGPPVVLLHGIGLDAASVSWRYALPHLAHHHRVIAPNFPGHGESDESESNTTDFYIEVLDELLAALRVETVNLVGISMGGAVALGHALDAPEQVERLVLVDSYGLGRDAPWRPGGYALLRVPGFDELLGAGLALNPMVVAASLGGLVVNTPAEFLADVQQVVGPAAARTLGSWQRDEFRTCGLRTCYLDRLDELEMSTLLVHGREDPLFPLAWSKQAHKRIPNSRLEIFETCGHWPPREYPEKFNRIVGAFL